MRPAFLLVILLAAPLLPVQALLEEGPQPAGNAHFAGDGRRVLDEAALTASAPYGLGAVADHAITVTLADHPLLDRSSVTLHYAAEGQDPAVQGRLAAMAYAGTSGGGLRFTAVLRPDNLLGPLGQAESLVRFYVTYHMGTERTDRADGLGYHYVRDAAAPRIHDLELDGRTTT